MPAGIGAQIAFDVSLQRSFLGFGSLAATTITVTETIAAGDTIIVTSTGTTLGAPTDNASNTYTALAITNGAGFANTYGCISTKAAAAGTLIITPPATTVHVSYVHYDNVGAFGVANSARGGPSIPSTGSLTLTKPSAIVVSAFCAQAETPGSGYSLIYAGTTTTIAIQQIINTPAGITTTSFGTSASSWSATAVSLI